MSLSESEFYEAGMSLPPDVRKHVALRLLEPVDPERRASPGTTRRLTVRAGMTETWFDAAVLTGRF